MAEVTGCSAAQQKVLASGEPADIQLGACIATAALTGQLISAIATTCLTDEITVGKVLLEAATTKGSLKPTALQLTPAYREAVARALDGGL